VGNERQLSIIAVGMEGALLSTSHLFNPSRLTDLLLAS